MVNMNSGQNEGLKIMSFTPSPNHMPGRNGAEMSCPAVNEVGVCLSVCVCVCARVRVRVCVCRA